MEKTHTSLSKILFPEEHISTALNKLLDNGIAESRHLLEETTSLYEQSKIEINSALHRYNAVTTQIQKMQMDLDGISKADLQQAYSTAMDAQQKMLVIRGQTDKLKSEIVILTESVKLLETISIMIKDSNGVNFVSGVKDSAAILEMVVDAQETERQRLSRQIHDGPAQVLSNLIIQAEITQKYFDMDQNIARQELSNLKSTVVNTFQMIRDFIYELRPMMLDDLGFFPTIKRYIETFKEQYQIDIRITIQGKEKRLEPYLETMLFRTVQELLRNTYQHNRDNLSALRIDINIIIDEHNLSLSVEDTGRGFDPQIIAQSKGMGLKLIRERIEMVNGSFEIESSIHQGCNVKLKVPYLEVESLPKNNEDRVIRQ